MIDDGHPIVIDPNFGNSPNDPRQPHEKQQGGQVRQSSQTGSNEVENRQHDDHREDGPDADSSSMRGDDDRRSHGAPDGVRQVVVCGDVGIPVVS